MFRPAANTTFIVSAIHGDRRWRLNHEHVASGQTTGLRHHDDRIPFPVGPGQHHCAIWELLQIRGIRVQGRQVRLQQATAAVHGIEIEHPVNGIVVTGTHFNNHPSRTA